MNNIRYVVLSRVNDVERRIKFSEQTKKININYSFFNAYTPQDLPKELNLLLDISLTPGERACAYSHIKILEQLLESEDKSIIVLEDDALLNANLLLLQSELHRIHNDFDVVILGYSKVEEKLKSAIQFFRPLIKEKEYGKFFVGTPYHQWKCGTVCYSTSRKGAEKLIEINKKAQFTADDWNTFELNGIKIGHLMPILVIEDIESCPSTLEKDRNSLIKRNVLLRYFAGAIRHLFLVGPLLKRIFR